MKQRGSGVQADLGLTIPNSGEKSGNGTTACSIVASMAHATIIVDITRPAELAMSEEWFAKWAPSLTYQSADQGCGCCVNIWDVEGTDEAVADLPSNIKADNAWIRRGSH